VLAISFSFALMGMFPQDRWLFMAVLIAYVGFCTYMMGESRYPYFRPPDLKGFYHDTIS
jgi:hypothetical protein